MLRYHNSQLQVYDGYTWLAIGSGSSVGLTSNAEEALAWAWLKMTQEKAAQDLAQKYPAVANALDAVRLAEQQLKTVVALCTV
jgi:myo-inositol catabolism protein IolC